MYRSTLRRSCVQIAVLLLTSGIQAQPRQSASLSADVIPNDNQRTAGELRNGLLRISVEAREGSWQPEPGAGTALRVHVFGERRGRPQNPGPLIRVPQGTLVDFSVRNL